jgi:hypothetical protein
VELVMSRDFLLRMVLCIVAGAAVFVMLAWLLMIWTRG